jgi:hypothetical protein
MARAKDERALLPIYTHEHVERFLTFDSVDAQRFSAIFGQLLQYGNFFSAPPSKTTSMKS